MSDATVENPDPQEVLLDVQTVFRVHCGRELDADAEQAFRALFQKSVGGALQRNVPWDGLTTTFVLERAESIARRTCASAGDGPVTAEVLTRAYQEEVDEWQPRCRTGLDGGGIEKARRGAFCPTDGV